MDPFGFYTTSSLEAGLNDAFVNDAFGRMNSADQPGATGSKSSKPAPLLRAPLLCVGRFYLQGTIALCVLLITICRNAAVTNEFSA